MVYKILTPQDLSRDIQKHEFAIGVLQGLWQEGRKKHIDSKFFYDDKGSDLFRRITRLDDYYLTSKEKEILEENCSRLADEAGQHEFRVIELGPGDGVKTETILKEMLKKDVPFTYVPVDISEGAMKTLDHRVKNNFPDLIIKGIVSEYLPGLHNIYEEDKLNPKRNLVLFLGSNIGNFFPEDAQRFFKSLWYSLKPRDLVLTGFDLRSGKKSLRVIQKAYNDSQGITAKFNLNLLERINRELSGNFALEAFSHHSYYDPKTNAITSYLISKRAQSVTINDLSSSFDFEPGEGLHLEWSHKYSLNEIHKYASETGFDLIKTFTDSDEWFADSLWRVKK